MLPALKSFMKDAKVKASLRTSLNLLRAKRIMPKQSLDAVLGCFTAPQVCFLWCWTLVPITHESSERNRKDCPFQHQLYKKPSIVYAGLPGSITHAMT